MGHCMSRLHPHRHDEHVNPSSKITKQKDTRTKTSAKVTPLKKPAARKVDGKEKEKEAQRRRDYESSSAIQTNLMMNQLMMNAFIGTF